MLCQARAARLRHAARAAQRRAPALARRPRTPRAGPRPAACALGRRPCRATCAAQAAHEAVRARPPSARAVPRQRRAAPPATHHARSSAARASGLHESGDARLTPEPPSASPMNSLMESPMNSLRETRRSAAQKQAGSGSKPPVLADTRARLLGTLRPPPRAPRAASC